jgi:hypothetical protein
VPETAVDEDDLTARHEYEVRSTGQIGPMQPEAIAERSGVSVSMLSMVERGQKVPRDGGGKMGKKQGFHTAPPPQPTIKTQCGKEFGSRLHRSAARLDGRRKHQRSAKPRGHNAEAVWLGKMRTVSC